MSSEVGCGVVGLRDIPDGSLSAGHYPLPLCRHVRYVRSSPEEYLIHLDSRW